MSADVVGLDLSLTATGMATGDRTLVIKTKARGMERLRFIRFAVMAELPTEAVVYLEGYSFGSRGSSIFQLGELGGVIRLALHEAHIPCVEVSPSTLKMFATGKGNAPKVDVLIAARDRLGYTGSNDNEADALWLRALGCHLRGHPLANLPKTHLRALDKFKGA